MVCRVITRLLLAVPAVATTSVLFLASALSFLSVFCVNTIIHEPLHT